MKVDDYGLVLALRVLGSGMVIMEGVLRIVNATVIVEIGDIQRITHQDDDDLRVTKITTQGAQGGGPVHPTPKLIARVVPVSGFSVHLL